MKLREAIAAFVAAEEGLSITEPRAVTIKRVYPFLPPARDELELPLIMHQYRPLSHQRAIGGLRMRRYALNIQILLCTMPNEESDVWSEIAAEFDNALGARLDANVKLGQQETYQRLFDFGGNEYQPTRLEWNGAAYLGSQYEYELMIDDVGTFAAG